MKRKFVLASYAPPQNPIFIGEIVDEETAEIQPLSEICPRCQEAVPTTVDDLCDNCQADLKFILAEAV